MVDLHWLHSICLVRIHACLIHDWLIEVFSLVTKDPIVRSALHHTEIVFPVACQLEVAFCGWERFRLSFFKRHAGLIHQCLHVLMRCLSIRQAGEPFDLGVLPRTNGCDPWQLVGRVGVPDSEARCELLGLLVEVLTEELVQLRITVTRGHMKSIVPTSALFFTHLLTATVVMMSSCCHLLL